MKSESILDAAFSGFRLVRPGHGKFGLGDRILVMSPEAGAKMAGGYCTDQVSRARTHSTRVDAVIAFFDGTIGRRTSAPRTGER